MNALGRLADVLVNAGVVDAAGIARALDAQAARSRSAAAPAPTTLGRVLADLGLADEAVVARTIATALRLEYHDTPPAATAALGTLLPRRFLPQARHVSDRAHRPAACRWRSPIRSTSACCRTWSSGPGRRSRRSSSRRQWLEQALGLDARRGAASVGAAADALRHAPERRAGGRDRSERARARSRRSGDAGQGHQPAADRAASST